MPLLGGPSIGMHKPIPVSIYGGDIPTLLYSDPRLGGDGKTRLNPDKTLAKWQWIAANNQSNTRAVLVAGQTLMYGLTVKSTGKAEEGDFEAFTFITRSAPTAGGTPRVAVRPYVNTPTVNRYLSNLPVPSTLLSGTSQLPGVFPIGIYCLPKTSWSFECKNLNQSSSTAFSIALFGRQFDNCSPCASTKLRMRAQHLQWIHPYWIVPQDPSTPSLTGPEVTLLPQAQVELTFPIPSSADFLMFGMLDDSEGTNGGEPGIYAQIKQNDSQRGLVDLSGVIPPSGSGASQLGISWRDFLAIPTVGVTGFPDAGRIHAYSLAPNMGGVTHIAARNTQIVIRFSNPDQSNTITLRPALYGLLVYGQQPPDRQTSIDGQANRERIAQGEEFLRRMGLTSAFGQGAAR